MVLLVVLVDELLLFFADDVDFVAAPAPEQSNDMAIDADARFIAAGEGKNPVPMPIAVVTTVWIGVVAGPKISGGGMVDSQSVNMPIIARLVVSFK